MEAPATVLAESPAMATVAPAPRPDAARRPSTVGYWVGGAVAAVGVIVAILAVVAGFVRMTDRVEGLQRVAVPGTAEVVFADAGGYTAYYEAAGITAGRDVGEVAVALTPVAGGDAVAFSDYGGELEYSASGHEGRALWTFRIDDPGTYRLATTGDAAALGTVAVGRSVAGTLVTTVLVAVGLGLCGLGAGAAIAVSTAVRRRRWSRPRPGAT